jgi:fructuronate reductase
MKLNEILSDSFNAAEWEAKGYELPKYDIAAVAKKTHDEPTWVHFGVTPRPFRLSTLLITFPVPS